MDGLIITLDMVGGPACGGSIETSELVDSLQINHSFTEISKDGSTNFICEVHLYALSVSKIYFIYTNTILSQEKISG